MVTYDCIHHFEPRTARPLASPFDIPESCFLFQDTLLIFDHLYQSLKLVSHVHLPSSADAASIPTLYSSAVERVHALANKVLSPTTPLPVQPPILRGQTFTSNVGKEGYESFVTKLKEHIVKGDIIQAVPSQRLARPTSLHPFNAYRQLRSLNPSPYMFYIDFGDLQLVGASPETLCKVEKRKVYNHAIAGTVKRGKTPEGTPSPSPLLSLSSPLTDHTHACLRFFTEDAALGAGLLESAKDRAEHIMLVDLARNDVNRVCQPATVQVDDLMRLERFSHVIHLTSQISGILREDKTRWVLVLPHLAISITDADKPLGLTPSGLSSPPAPSRVRPRSRRLSSSAGSKKSDEASTPALSVGLTLTTTSSTRALPFER